ncbi:MAG: hypothetical protein DRI36_03615 [Caldiserica bacterium]|nr:MAG: hypothetical protein DRI36_03615 [Caldisericota bacterium]
MISIETHLNLLKSNQVVEKITEKLGVKETIAKIRRKLNPERIKNTTLIELKVKDTNPEFAKKLADTWAEVYLDVSRSIAGGELEKSFDFLYKEYENVRKELENKEEEYRRFLRESDFDLIKTKLDTLKEKVKNYEKQLLTKKDSIKILEEKINVLKEELRKHDRFITLSKAISDEALWQKVEKTEDIWKSLKDKKLATQVLNPVYQDIEKKLAEANIELASLKREYEYIKSEYRRTRDEYERLEKTLNKLIQRKISYERDIDLIKKKFNAVFSRLTDAIIASKANIGDVKIVSFAEVPEYPVSPRKRLIVGVSFVISFILSIILSFLIEFIQNLSKQA